MVQWCALNHNPNMKHYARYHYHLKLKMLWGDSDWLERKFASTKSFVVSVRVRLTLRSEIKLCSNVSINCIKRLREKKNLKTPFSFPSIQSVMHTHGQSQPFHTAKIYILHIILLWNAKWWCILLCIVPR